MNFYQQIVIYCDGACSGNPGPGGWGSILIFKDEVIELGNSKKLTTNNQMELSGVIESLNFIFSKEMFKNANTITIYTDSVYVIRGMTQWLHGWKKRGWKTAENNDVSNKEYWLDLEAITQKIRKENSEIKWEWKFVKGHAGIAGNERCDQIAVAFSKNDYIDLFKGSAKSYHFDPFILPEDRPLPEMKKKSSDEKKVVWYISYVNGVFSKHQTWKECEALVKGRAAKFKKVSSVEEENQIKKSWGV